MRNLLIVVVCLFGLSTVGAQSQDSTRLQGFSVVLVHGEAQGGVPSQGLSASAQKALADIRDFLPYRGYRVLDTQWIAGSAVGTSKGRIRGLDQKDYDFNLHTFPGEMSSKPGVPSGVLNQARFQLVSPATGFTQNGTKIGADTLLDSSFAIRTGETVVVGTSRVQGDSALIVLLTAVAAK